MRAGSDLGIHRIGETESAFEQAGPAAEALQEELAQLFSGLIDEPHDAIGALLWKSRDAFAEGRLEMGVLAFTSFRAKLEAQLRAERAMYHRLDRQGPRVGAIPTLPLWMECGQVCILLDEAAQVLEEGQAPAAELEALTEVLESYRVTQSVVLEHLSDSAADADALAEMLEALGAAAQPGPGRRHAA
jgi:hypothetical protein